MNNTYRNQILTGEWESIRRMDSDDREIISYPHLPWSKVYFFNDGYSHMTEKQSAAMYEEVYKSIDDYENEVARTNKRLMKVIKKVKGAAFYRNLSSLLKELKDGCYHKEQMKFELTRKATGDFQCEPRGREIKGVWVDQVSVGTEGDSWEGSMYVKIDEKRFFCVNYSM